MTLTKSDPSKIQNLIQNIGYMYWKKTKCKLRLFIIIILNRKNYGVSLHSFPKPCVINLIDWYTDLKLTEHGFLLEGFWLGFCHYLTKISNCGNWPIKKTVGIKVTTLPQWL